VRYDSIKSPGRSSIERLLIKFKQAGAITESKNGIVGRNEMRLPEEIAHVQYAH
jgi:hypothetical protein